MESREPSWGHKSTPNSSNKHIACLCSTCGEQVIPMVDGGLRMLGILMLALEAVRTRCQLWRSMALIWPS